MAKKIPQLSPVDATLETLKRRFRKFMWGTDRIAWLKAPLAKVYVRKSMRAVGDHIVPCLDLANIDVAENYQKHGIMTRFTQFLETFWQPVYVENILHPKVLRSFLRRGYVKFEGDLLGLTVVKVLGHKDKPK